MEKKKPLITGEDGVKALEIAQAAAAIFSQKQSNKTGELKEIILG